MARRDGFTITELLIAVSVLGIAILGTTTFLINSSDSLNRVQDNRARDGIVDIVRKAVADQNVLRLSADLPGNGELKRCLERTALVDCVTTSPDRQVDFTLGSFNTTGVFRGNISGTGAAPVLYDGSGAPNCVVGPNTPRCPSWRVRTSFWAACANLAPSCAQATTIFVRFQVYPATERKWKGSIPAAVPPEPAYSNPTAPVTKASFAEPIQIRQALDVNQQCPAGSQQTGFDASGRIVCVCLPNATQIGVVNNAGTLMPICKLNSDQCPPGQMAAGRLPNGSIKCGAPVIAFDPPAILMNSQRCKPSSWLRSTSVSGCVILQGASRKDPVRIRCGANTGNCYKESPPP